MKSNIFFKQLIFGLSMSILMIACSSLSSKYDDTTTIHNQEKIELNRFKHANAQNNKAIDDQIQLKNQELKSNNVIYFPLDQYDIPSQFFYSLNIHANFLYNNPLQYMIIEGHADERGTPEYNIALGERRANSVKSYLQSKGVLSEQMLTVSYGKEKPAVLGQNEEAYSKNRRAVLKYK
ncbi:peptidoglycan-associated lipoprotein Pal [Blochmannia endosymbiont of Camponotus sp. C-003]|uniref:peptidoglycan-associated lipoprotein Pal n=1 Tax=Blochmannia endosymbiont of Camponotus sp. C-003 TaxID=2945588 RepID=UPI00202558DC|nr:peptidoglycan-associated lipoprotein Pal [Blochmannia endosymbiont of Camponotus sp. C-003]URJ23474.1 peptidoglycan-associated lipoprotein Pal [Blochmannia endosymbiont of Camponotus sp. C-003]